MRRAPLGNAHSRPVPGAWLRTAAWHGPAHPSCACRLALPRPSVWSMRSGQRHVQRLVCWMGRVTGRMYGKGGADLRSARAGPVVRVP